MNNEALNTQNQTSSAETLTETDVIIVGAGPVGLFAIFQCGMLGMRCHVIDALPDIGGQCSALYPEKPIYDIPAFPVVSGQDLIQQLEQQAKPFNPVYHLGQTIDSLNKTEDDHWLMETSKGAVIKTKSVILAAGAGAFGPNRPPLEGIEKYEGTGVHYMVRTREKFAGKTLVIAGGGDSAVDWALSLGEIAKKVYVVHRRDKFRAAADNVSKLHAHHKDPNHPIELVVPYQLKALQGDGTDLTHVTIATLKGEERSLQADYLLPFFGIVPDMSNLEQWGLEFNGHQITVDPVHCETSKKGIYAIGDVADYEGKLKLILTGFAEAAQAAHHCYTRSNPDQALHFEYSTSKGVPGAA